MAKAVKPKKKLDFNPVSGEFDLVTDNNFSYEEVPEDKRLRIRDNHQMALHGCHKVDGTLIVEGTLVVTE